jgi:hypothetical protein
LALWRLPAMTAVIVARIHWQALKLWAKNLAIVRKPAPPPAFVTRGVARIDAPPQAESPPTAPTLPDAPAAHRPA